MIEITGWMRAIALLTVLFSNFLLIFIFNKKSENGQTKMQELFGSRKVFFGFLVLIDVSIMLSLSFIDSKQWIDLVKYNIGFVVGGNIVEHLIKNTTKTK